MLGMQGGVKKQTRHDMRWVRFVAVNEQYEAKREQLGSVIMAPLPLRTCTREMAIGFTGTLNAFVYWPARPEPLGVMAQEFWRVAALKGEAGSRPMR